MYNVFLLYLQRASWHSSKVFVLFYVLFLCKCLLYYGHPIAVNKYINISMRWAGHVARMGERIGVYRVLVGKTEGKRPLGRPRRRWEDNIKMDLQEV